MQFAPQIHMLTLFGDRNLNTDDDKLVMSISVYIQSVDSSGTMGTMFCRDMMRAMRQCCSGYIQTV